MGRSRSMALAALALLACGDEASSDRDASGAGDAAVAVDSDPGVPDAGPTGRADAGPTDGSDAGDVGHFSPGDPPSGDEELQIFASRDEDVLENVAPVRHGDRLLWQCGTQAAGIGHIWANFRLETAELDRLSESERDLVDAKLELIDQFDVVIADNEGLFDALDFSVPGALALDQNVRMIINRGGKMPVNAQPSNEDEKIVLFRVTVELPTGRVFVRQAWVDTLVPPSQKSDNPGEGC